MISAVDVSAEIFKPMKRAAERHTQGREVKNCVIAVPAYFDPRQEKAIREAAELAGFNVLSLLAEPIAAELATRLHEI